MCIGRGAPFVRSTRSHKIQTGTGRESIPFVRRIGPDKTPLASSTPGRSSRETVIRGNFRAVRRVANNPAVDHGGAVQGDRAHAKENRSQARLSQERAAPA